MVKTFCTFFSYQCQFGVGHGVSSIFEKVETASGDKCSIKRNTIILLLLAPSSIFSECYVFSVFAKFLAHFDDIQTEILSITEYRSISIDYLAITYMR